MSNTTQTTSSVTVTNSILGSVSASHILIISMEEHEFFTEAKNFIQDVASSEDVPAGFREQAQRMVARLVMKKL